MSLIYSVTLEDLPFHKIGYWNGSIKGLQSRYQTILSSQLNLIVYEIDENKKIKLVEEHVHTCMNRYHIENELFRKDVGYLENFMDLMNRIAKPFVSIVRNISLRTQAFPIGSVRCKRCEQVLSSPSNLAQHLNRLIPCKPIAEYRYHCKKCNKGFDKYKNKWQHEKKCGGRKTTAEEDRITIERLRSVMVAANTNSALSETTDKFSTENIVDASDVPTMDKNANVQPSDLTSSSTGSGWSGAIDSHVRYSDRELEIIKEKRLIAEAEIHKAIKIVQADKLIKIAEIEANKAIKVAEADTAAKLAEIERMKIELEMMRFKRG